MNRKSVKGACAVSIIRGNDGPTSVFIAGKPVDQNIFVRMKSAYRKKRHAGKRAAVVRSIKAEPHTLDEVIDYMIKQYGAVEPDQNSHQVKEGYRNVKGAPGKKKQLDKILKDIYSYYGVTKEDIADNTDRMKALVVVLSS